MENNIKITVVTACFNSKDYIKKAIDSVLFQNYKNVEYIIVDGGSKDGTLDILSSYGNKIKWISEPDNGIYDALSKGFKLATGDVITWLDSDNYYLSDDVLNSVAENFLQDEKIDLVITNSIIIYPEYNKKIKRIPDQRITYEKLLKHGNEFIPEGMFYKKSLYEKVHGFDFQFKLLADYDLWLKFFKAGVVYNKLEKNSSAYIVRKDALLRQSPFMAWKETFIIGQKYGRSLINRLYFRLLFIKVIILYPIKYVLKRSCLFQKFYKYFNSVC